MHGEAELARHGAAGWLIGADTPSEMLDGKITRFLAWCDGELIAVCNNTDQHAIEFWDWPGKSLCSCRPAAPEKSGQEQTESSSPPAAEHISTVRGVADNS